jgi:hypothetical protein
MPHQQNNLTMDSSRFLLRENQLRNCIGKWMRTNRSKTEMLELCLDHFYGDQPKLLAWSLDIVDGDTRDLVISRIICDSKVTPAHAETIYDQIQSTIALSRKLVEQGSAPPAVPVAPQTGFQRPQVAPAGVAQLGYSEQPEFTIVNRPSSISACALLLLLSAALTATFVIGHFEGSKAIVQQAGAAGVFFGIALTAVCGWGYWTMKRWAVLLYALEPIVRLWMGMSHMLIAIPVLIVFVGFMNFREMTWK